MTASSDSSKLTASPATLGSSYAALLNADSFLSLGSMEGVYEPVVTKPSAPVVPARVAELLPGYLLAAGVGVLAVLVHDLPVWPFTSQGPEGTRHPVSTTIIAITLGLLLRNLLPLPETVRTGCKHIVKKIIPLAIVCTGAGLNLVALGSVGLTALMITVICIGVAVGGCYFLGRFMGLGWKTSLLLGTGTGICGNSAIVAVAPLVDAEDDDLVISIGAVNLFGLVTMLALPALGGLMHMNSEAFGVWAGTSIHAVPQVVAAGFAYTPEAGTLATLVKLVRVTMLAPLVFLLAIMYRRDHPAMQDSTAPFTVRYARLVPWFVWGFLLLAVCNSLGLLPTMEFPHAPALAAFGFESGLRAPLGGMFEYVGKVFLILAMAAIGLEVNLRVLLRAGSTAIRAGLICTLLLVAVSLVLITFLL